MRKKDYSKTVKAKEVIVCLPCLPSSSLASLPARGPAKLRLRVLHLVSGRNRMSRSSLVEVRAFTPADNLTCSAFSSIFDISNLISASRQMRR